MNLKRIFLIVKYLLLLSILIFTQTCKKNKTARIDLIFTSSMMGYVEQCGCGYDRGGFERKATVIDSLIHYTEANKTFLIDAGNNIVLSKDLMLQKKYIPQVLNFFNYDLLTLGVDEVKIGFDLLNDVISDNNYSFLSGNGNFRKEIKKTKKYKILKYNGIKIGFYNIFAKEFFNAHYISDNIEDRVEVIQKEINHLNKKCDYVIVFLQGSDTFFRKYVESLENIDLYFLALSRQLYPNITIHGQKPYRVISTGTKGEFVGLLELGYDNGIKIKENYNLYVLNDKIRPNIEASKIVMEYKKEKRDEK